MTNKSIPRELTNKERKEIRKLVLENYTNYNRTYGCLPLDCDRYMLEKWYTSSFCKYFRSAVLLIHPELEAAITDQYLPTKPCRIYSKHFPVIGDFFVCFSLGGIFHPMYSKPTSKPLHFRFDLGVKSMQFMTISMTKLPLFILFLWETPFERITMEAKLLYEILLSRINGWSDEQGRVYVYFTMREVMEKLCCGEQKASNLIKTLENHNLIHRKRKGCGSPIKFFHLR